MVTFLLMTEKGWFCLREILKTGFKESISKVIVGRDNNLVKDYAEEIIGLCQEHKIRFEERESGYIIDTPYAIAISWRWILPINTSTIIIIIHDSLLPKYRGFNPLVSQLINNEKIIGATAIIASTKYDEGDILFQEEIEITYPIKIKEGIRLISNIYVTLILRILDCIQTGETLWGIKQKHGEATYSVWRDKKDYFINWTWEASKIKRFVDALGDPYEGAKCFVDGQVVVLEEVEEQNELMIENRDVGKSLMLIDGYPIVICGKGMLKIVKAKYEINMGELLPTVKVKIRFS